MAKFAEHPTIQLNITMQLTEAEATALARMSEYSLCDIAKAIGDQTTKDLMPGGPHYKALLEFLTSCEQLQRIIGGARDARKMFAMDAQVRTNAIYYAFGQQKEKDNG